MIGTVVNRDKRQPGTIFSLRFPNKEPVPVVHLFAKRFRTRALQGMARPFLYRFLYLLLYHPTSLDEGNHQEKSPRHLLFGMPLS